MNLIKHSFSLLPLSLLFLTSCKNDLKLNAPYKEVPSIYAVFSPQDKIQMVRVNKVFLGEGDANAMAQVADSINYPAGELEVTLERYVNGARTVASKSNLEVITFRDSVIQASSGAFNSSQRVYVTGERLFTSGEYQLKVKNKHTNNEFVAKSQSLDSVPSGISPFTTNNLYGNPDNVNYLGNKGVYIDYSEPAKTYVVRYIPNEAIVYQLTFRLHYIDSTNQGAQIPNSVDFQFARQNKREVTYTGGQAFLVNSFRGADLYSTVGNALSKIPVPANLKGRRMYKIEFNVHTSTQDYLDYLEFAAPSLSIAQEKPLYSNFIDRKALGLFAFRSRYAIQRDMDKVFVDQFAINASTCKHKFFSVSNGVSLKNCP
jgi:hypothetical protein